MIFMIIIIDSNHFPSSSRMSLGGSIDNNDDNDNNDTIMIIIMIISIIIMIKRVSPSGLIDDGSRHHG